MSLTILRWCAVVRGFHRDKDPKKVSIATTFVHAASMIPLHTWNGLVTNILSDTVTRCTMQRIFRYLGTSLVILAAWKSSGVTKVGVIRGGNWRCHPYFFLKKTGDLFSHHYHFYWLHSGVTPPLERCHTAPFLFARPRLSTILCKFVHKFFFSFGCHPLEGVTWGGPPPPP